MNARIDIEPARGFLARLRGLILRAAPFAGTALWLPNCRCIHTACMSFAIDVIFIDAEGYIRDIRTRVPPWRMVACRQAHGVLEMQVGEVHRLGLRLGDQVALNRERPRAVQPHVRQSGAALVEFVIVIPLLLFVLMGIAQAALGLHAKSSLNYAVFSAARAGTLNHARIASVYSALEQAMNPYYGGGTTLGELSQSSAAAAMDFAQGAARVEILSPTAQSFDDFYSPELSAAAGVRAIPSTDLIHLRCPRDRTDCPWNSASNSSGQSLQDANLLAVRVTYGIPPAKQVPIAGRFYSWALQQLGTGGDDEFVRELLAAGRIPVVARTTLRMMSDAYEPGAFSYRGGSVRPVSPRPPTAALPSCPNWNPDCDSDQGGSPGGSGNAGGVGDGSGGTWPRCNPRSDPGCLPHHCRPGDPQCDPNCGVRICCTAAAP